jgi:hypothetical protein
VGASLVSPGTRLLVVTNKISMLSSSHSTQTLTILSKIRRRLSSAGLVLGLGLVEVSWRHMVSPIMRRAMVAGQIKIRVHTVSSLKKIELAH